MDSATNPNTGRGSQDSDIISGENDPARSIPNKLPALSTEALASLQASKKETGFDSYRTYLEFHRAAYPRLERLSAYLDARPHHKHRQLGWAGSVLNVSKSRSVLVDPIHQLSEGGTEIIEALCHPPENAGLQIVLWNISRTDDFWTQEDLFDYLGLRFRLDLRIFNAILYCMQQSETRGSQLGMLDCYEPTYVRVGSVIATVRYSRHLSNTLPIVLIAGPFDQGSYTLLVENGADRYGPCPPFSQSTALGTLYDAIPSSGIYQYYRQLLMIMLERYHRIEDDSFYLPFLCVLPLFQLNLLKVRSDGHLLRVVFDEHSDQRRRVPLEDDYCDDSLQQFRSRLRLRMVDAEDDWRRFVTYMRKRIHRGSSATPFCQDYEDELGETIAEASRLESQVRDYMQLYAGRLGLKESRNSIELSNRQIEEAQRVKIFTILAFVYVPLNLATSIYGMNLQQLNGSGQSVREFMLTALIALIITGGTWYVAEAVNGYRIWQSKRQRSEVPAPKYSMAERVAMITWLLREGYGSWMKRTGAWLRILFNSRKPFIEMDDEDYEVPVGELVSKFSLGDASFDPESWAPKRKSSRNP
ncbi:MAG: hypothetical protein Q9225_005277 [Loekoesia sp. 1 TL-2023]